MLMTRTTSRIEPDERRFDRGAWVTVPSSDIAIVVSTLAIAALFSPLPNCIQDIIDRQLYRRNYDAEHTLGQFNQIARGEVNLEQLSAALVSVVHDTLQPNRISLWVISPTTVNEERK